MTSSIQESIQKLTSYESRLNKGWVTASEQIDLLAVLDKINNNIFNAELDLKSKKIICHAENNPSGTLDAEAQLAQLASIRNIWGRVYNKCLDTFINEIDQSFLNVLSSTNPEKSLSLLQTLNKTLTLVSRNEYLSTEQKRRIASLLTEIQAHENSLNQTLEKMQDILNRCQNFLNQLQNSDLASSALLFYSLPEEIQLILCRKLHELYRPQIVAVDHLVKQCLDGRFTKQQVLTAFNQLLNQSANPTTTIVQSHPLSDLEQMPQEVLSLMATHLCPEDIAHVNCTSKELQYRTRDPHLNQQVLEASYVQTLDEYLMHKKITKSLSQGYYTCNQVTDIPLSFSLSGPSNKFVISEDKIYTATYGSELYVFDLKTKRWINLLQRSNNEMCYLAFSNSKVCIITHGYITQILQISSDGETGSLQSTNMQIEMIDPITNARRIINLEQNDTLIKEVSDSQAFGAGFGIIRIFDLNNGKCTKTLEHKNLVHSLVVRKKRLFSASSSEVKIWDLKTYQCIKDITFKPGYISSLKVSGNLIAITIIRGGFPNRFAKVYDYKNNKVITSLSFECGLSNPLSIEISGNKLFIALPSGIEVVDLKTNTTLPKLLTSSRACSMQVEGDTLFTANEAYGCEILQMFKLTASAQETLLNLVSEYINLPKRVANLPAAIRNAIYGELYNIVCFQNDYWGCAEDAFLEKGEFVDFQKRQLAILTYVYRPEMNEIAALFGKDSPIAMKRFRNLPLQLQGAIYGELYKIKHFQNDYWDCAAEAFNNVYGQPSATDEERATAIRNYLKPRNPNTNSNEN